MRANGNENSDINVPIPGTSSILNAVSEALLYITAILLAQLV